MKRKYKSKVMVFLSIMFVLLLLIAGCGSDSDSDDDDPITDPDRDKPVDATLTDFIGNWQMWEQRGYTDLSCSGPDSAAEEVEYNIKIEQSGNQALIYLFDDENQSLSCQPDGNELVCQGNYNWGDGWGITYNEYRIYFVGTGHTELKGDVTWTISNNGNECHGTSDLCTTCTTGHPGDGRPGGGSGPGDTRVENCTNGSDDDGDSNIDCDDSDCATDSACTDGGEGEDTYTNGCTNGSDDDGDGDIDCDDSDCATDSACTSGDELTCGTEVCTPVSNNGSTCVTSGNCDSVCTGSNCDYQCGGDANCNFVCNGSGCDMSCQDDANCNMRCNGSGCNMSCLGDANCDMSCEGDGCNFTCDTTGNCLTSCPNGDCTGG